MTSSKDNDCYVSWSVYGDDVIPENISNELQVDFDKAHCKGEVFYSRSRSTVRKTGFWTWSTDKKLASNNLNLHIDYLVHHLLHCNRSFVTNLVDSSAFDVRVSCYWVLANDFTGPELSQSSLMALSWSCNDLVFTIMSDFDD